MKALIVTKQISRWLLAVGCWLAAWAAHGGEPASHWSEPEKCLACGLSCPADMVVNTDPGLCSAVANYVVTVIDPGLCSGALMQTTGLPSGSAFTLGATVNTFEIDDLFFNTFTCSFTVTVQDAELPVILNCPANIAVNTAPGTCSATANWVEPDAIDNCGFGSFVRSHIPGSVFPAGTTAVTYTATDATGNISSCVFDVLVDDMELPVILNCPANIAVNTAPGTCSATANWVEPDAIDNCGFGSFVRSHIPGSVFPAGTTAVTYTATDATGNISSCVFDVLVDDVEPPIISGCPADLMINNDPGVCEAAVFWTAPNASDNCGIASFTSNFSSGDLFPLGTTTVTYTATDNLGLTATCVFDVVVLDNEAPSITGCPANTTVNNDPGVCEAAVFWTAPNASDNCGIASFTSNFSSGDVFPLGTTTVTYTATDNLGLTATCAFDVVVLDNEAPSITGCPANTTVNNDPGVCEAAAFWAAPIATDNCGIASFTSNFSPGDVFPLGTTTVTFTATDNAGLTVICSFDVSVADNENPIITGCPASFGVSNDPGVCEAAAFWAAPIATDNCGIDSFTSNFSPGDVFPLGTTTVTYTATDNAGLTVICSFDVTVADNENPTITGCPVNILMGNDPGDCQALVNWAVPTAVDNCGITSFATTILPGTIFPIGFTTVIYTATDNAGLTAICSFDVTVADDEAPILANCPANITVQVNTANCDAIVAWSLPIFLDNCGSGNLSATHNPGDVFPVGNTTVVYSGTDNAGNSTQCSFEITVEDGASSVQMTESICQGETFIVGNQSFSQTGNYTVTLTAVGGCDSVVNLTLTVLPVFTTNLTESICQGETYIVGNQSFNQTGTYAVMLTASASGGCDSLVNLNLTVFQNPNAMIFGPNSVCLGLGILLSAGAFDAYAWSPSGATTPTIQVTSSGSYGVTVTDQNGCTSTASTSIVEAVCLDVVAAFSISQDTVCASQFLQFVNQSSVNATTFLWSFGNGSFSNAPNPTIFYQTPGSYTISLIASDGMASDTTFQQVFVYPKIQAAFSTDVPEGCQPKSLVFNDLSSATFPLSGWNWNFGDGSTGSAQTTSHSYTNFDTVNVTQVVVDQFGCVDSTNQNVVVADLGTTPAPVHLCLNLCEGDSLVVGNSVFNAANPIGSATLTAASGCDSMVMVELTFTPLLQSVLMADFSICENENATLDAGNGTSFLWSNGAAAQTINITQPGSYVVTVADGIGCPVVKSVTVSVDEIPSVNAVAGADVSICETTQIVALTAHSTPLGTGVWTSFGAAAINNPTNPASTVSGLDIGENWFVWTLSSGACKGFSSDTVAVHVTAEVTEAAQAGDDLSFCGSATAINLSAAQPQASGVVGTWSQPGSQAQLGIQILEPNNPNSPIAGFFPNNTYLFTWTLTNGACGAYSVDNVLVSTYASLLPPADAGLDQNLCDGVEAILAANLPTNTTGEWTQIGNAPSSFIAQPYDATTMVGDLAAGANAFAWTLSSADCLAYSSDTVLVFQSEGLAANADVYFNLGQPLTNLDFLANDKIPNRDAVTLTFRSTPLYGSLTANGDGSYDFQFGVDSTVNVEFTYEICLKDCPDLCAQAQVLILSKSPLPPPVIERPANVITPNGDGTGERLAIPNYSELPPPIEITVINRWGNVVFQEKNYENDWDGKTQDGKQLPDGTYFYILKGAGSEVSGAVTVVR